MRARTRSLLPHTTVTRAGSESSSRATCGRLPAPIDPPTSTMCASCAPRPCAAFAPATSAHGTHAGLAGMPSGTTRDTSTPWAANSSVNSGLGVYSASMSTSSQKGAQV